MIRRFQIAIVVGAVVASVACADLRLRKPKQPPTPANDLTREQLEAIPTPENERYYLIVFGSQSTPKLARFTHTWATAIKATCSDPSAEPTLEVHTISWMPAALKIRTLSRHTECGVNLSLEKTISEMKSHNERIAMWGPYEMKPGAFRRFIIQKEFLETHTIGYQCLDNRGEAARTGNGCDCIHALTDMDPDFDRSRYPLRWFGEAGSRNIVEQIARRGSVNPCETHDWLIPRLGLDCQDIVRRRYDGPVGDLDKSKGCPTPR